MKKKSFIKLILWIAASVILIFVFTILFLDYWVKNKILSTFNESKSKYQLEIDNVHVSIFTSAIELKSISINTKPEYINETKINGEIASVKFIGIDLSKAIFQSDFDISEVIISNGRLNGVFTASNDSSKTSLSPLNLTIGKLQFDKINLEIKKSESESSYLLKDGNLNVFNFQVLKNDTLSTGIVKTFDFKAEELRSTSSDSMYVLSANDVLYSTTSKTLSVNSFLIHPNFKGYDFTSRQKFQSDCIEGSFYKINFHDLSAADFIKSKSLVSSYIEIGKMDINVFRDLREKPSHAKKPMFQNLIYDYPGILNIDSIYLIKGNVTYTEHAIHANHPGRISFNEINAKIYKISNDTINKKEISYFELKSTALLMGNGQLDLHLKSRLFDSNNTFTLTGSLSAMEAKKLNPMLERNAFLFASSGRVDRMNFNFTANNNESNGKMTLLYHDFDIAVKNQDTDDTTAIKEIIVSWIANFKIMNSNPLPGKEVRVGIINFNRDQEAFLFNYCFKSILSGIKSSVGASTAKKKKN